MSEVKVLRTWFSPFVRRAEMALDLKGVEYEAIEEDVKNKSDLLTQHNPLLKKVPVLVHNGKTILESLVILEYIDEVWEGPPILPKDPDQSAMARFWANFVQEKCAVTTWKACWSEGKEREKAKKEAQEALQILDNQIKGKKFFGGDSIGFVDLASNFIAFWLEIIQEEAAVQIFTQEKFPNLWKWGQEFCNDSLAKKHLPDKDRMAAEFKIGFKNGRMY